MGAGSWLCLPMAELQYRQPAAGAAADVIAIFYFNLCQILVALKFLDKLVPVT